MYGINAKGHHLLVHNLKLHKIVWNKVMCCDKISKLLGWGHGMVCIWLDTYSQVAASEQTGTYTWKRRKSVYPRPTLVAGKWQYEDNTERLFMSRNYLREQFWENAGLSVQYMAVCPDIHVNYVVGITFSGQRNGNREFQSAALRPIG